MAIELSGLAQLVARLEVEGRGAGQSDLSAVDDSPVPPRDWDPPPPPAPPQADALAELAQAVAGARERLQALAGRVGELRRQVGGDGGGAARSPARPPK